MPPHTFLSKNYIFFNRMSVSHISIASRKKIPKNYNFYIDRRLYVDFTVINVLYTVRGAHDDEQ